MYMETVSTAGGEAIERRSPCGACPVRDRAVCSHLSGDALHSLFRRGRRMTLRRGETLMWEGDDATLVGTVRSGLLKLTSSMSDGREQILGLAFAGDFVGRPFSRVTGCNVTALTDTTLCLFGRSVFDSVASDHPELQHGLLLRALDELDHARRWMILLARKSAGERVATFLLEMASRSGTPDGEPVEIMLSRQQMADFLGLTIETVSRKLTQLRQSRVIRLPDLKNFVIVNAEALYGAAGEEDRLAA